MYAQDSSHQFRLQVPWWDEALREKMAEFPPIFKNTEIHREDVGPYMQAYLEDHGLMKRPRRNLIGSYFGMKMLVATPLLKTLVWFCFWSYLAILVEFAAINACP